MFQKRTGRLARFLDRSAGIFVLAALSFLRKRRSRPSHPRSFCFVKTGGMGDMVLLSAVIRQISLKYPEAEMTIVCSPENREAAELMTQCGVVVADHRRPFQLFKLRNLKACDVLIDFGAWPRFDALISLIIPSRWRIGFRTEGQHRHFCYDEISDHNKKIHELDNYYNIAGRYCEQTGVLPKLEAEKRAGLEKTVILHMYCGGHRYKCRMWAFENWVKLAKEIKNCGLYLAFTSYSAESPHLEAFLRNEGINAFIIADRPLVELASNFSSCLGVISVNCGISHFASACGAPVVELAGSVNPNRWGTLGANTACVAPPEIAKMLCYGFEKDADKNSMDKVSVADVFSVAKKTIPLY